MEKTPEEKLASLMGDSLLAKVKEKTDSFGGLLTQDAAIRLLCQENGISTERKLMLSEARASVLPFSFSARVGRIFPVQNFPGGSMRTVRLHISDKSGEATLVLWNEQAKLAEGNLLSGDSIECTGAYVRAGEISIGRNGGISRAGKNSALPVHELKEGLCNVQGRVDGVEGTRVYLDRRSGVEKKMLSFTLCGGGKCCRAVWWSPPDDAPQLRQGADVVLESASFRGGQIHLNAFSRVVLQGAAGGKSGEFGGVSFDGADAIIEIGGKKFRASEGEAFLLFGMSPAAGVHLRTLLMIKSSALAGNPADYSVEAGRLVSLKFQC